jgi:hypothetical protein
MNPFNRLCLFFSHELLDAVQLTAYYAFRGQIWCGGAMYH